MFSFTPALWILFAAYWLLFGNLAWRFARRRNWNKPTCVLYALGGFITGFASEVIEVLQAQPPKQDYKRNW